MLVKHFLHKLWNTFHGKLLDESLITLNKRDWHIYHELAMRLISRARKLYTEESLDIELETTIYALDSTTIDLRLNLFDWAPFRTTKAAIKMHTLLDLRGAIPAFIHISAGK